MPYAIETSKLTKRYGGVTALSDLDIQVEERETFGLLGPNGAGKTTAVKILTTLLRPTSGSARVGGFDVAGEPEKVRRIIGYLPQQLTSDDTITGYENLLFYSKLYGLPRGTREKRIAEALDLVVLRERAHEMVRTYSGGMKRRLELASVLVSRPRILFLDEPTLGLDPRSRAAVWEFVKKLSDSFETTIFLTTNYMDEADRLCDRVSIIDLGRVVVKGSPTDLKNSIGGDVIMLKTNASEERIEQMVKSHDYFTQVEFVNGTLRLVVEGKAGENVIPLLLAELRVQGSDVSSVTLQKPSLDDVFTSYTGKAFGQEVPMAGPRRMVDRAKLRRATRL